MERITRKAIIKRINQIDFIAIVDNPQGYILFKELSDDFEENYFLEFDEEKPIEIAKKLKASIPEDDDILDYITLLYDIVDADWNDILERIRDMLSRKNDKYLTSVEALMFDAGLRASSNIIYNEYFSK